MPPHSSKSFDRKPSAADSCRSPATYGRVTQVILQANETTVEISLPQDHETGVVLQAASEYSPRPYSTLVCSAVVEREAETQLANNDEWIHLVYPKQQSADVLAGEAETRPHSEYVGVLAKVISRKDIRVVDSFATAASIEA